MNVVLVGPPGAGKGTQAKRLETTLGLPHIASGDIFRAIVRDDSPLAHEVQGYMAKGLYVPDKLTIELVLHRLDEADAREGFVLDGFPRTQGQAEALDARLNDEQRRVDVALYITADTEVLVRRICGRIICPNCNAIYNEVTKPPRQLSVCDICGHEVIRRLDEEPEQVSARLDSYKEKTQPFVDYYRRAGVLTEIDGAAPRDQVDTAVDHALARATNEALA